jgi:hypothetical protein
MTNSLKITPDKARAIIAQAKVAEIYEGPVPEEDDKAVEEAEKLYQLAIDAWDQLVRGPEVESILRIASDDFDGSEELVVEEEPEPTEQEETESVSDEPWPGYSKETVANILKTLTDSYKNESVDPQILLSAVWEFESDNKNRSTILNQISKINERLVEKSADEETQEQPVATQEQEETVEESEEPLVGEVGEEPDATVGTESETVEQSEEDRPAEVEAEPVIEDSRPSVDHSVYHSIIEMVESELVKDRRHVPEPPESDIPQLPWDWTKASDGEIQRLYSYYSLLAYYKSFVLLREDRVALECKRAADELANELLKATDKYDEKGKHKTLTLLEKEVESDPNVSNWRRLQHKHEAYTASARRERDSLYKLVESLSRFETMRQQEWQRSGQVNYR